MEQQYSNIIEPNEPFKVRLANGGKVVEVVSFMPYLCHDVYTGFIYHHDDIDFKCPTEFLNDVRYGDYITDYCKDGAFGMSSVKMSNVVVNFNHHIIRQFTEDAVQANAIPTDTITMKVDWSEKPDALKHMTENAYRFLRSYLGGNEKPLSKNKMNNRWPIWAARDFDGQLWLSHTKPKLARTKFSHCPVKGAFMAVDRNYLPELTLENSPQKVELKLINNDRR